MNTTGNKNTIVAVVLLLIPVLLWLPSFARKDTTINQKRLTGVIITESTLFAGSMFGLYQLWYKDYPQSSFHFMNDNHEWLQMDKTGHAVTSYNIGKIGYITLRWCGIPEKQSVWYGGTIGFVYLLTIETLDGFSAEWGASTGDLIANTVGSGLFVGQQLLWKEQRLTLKYSFHRSKYAKYNPGLLGKNFLQEVVKDYNGQTFWLSANISSFINKENSFPKWLNIAVGYSADGLIGAGGNPDYIDNKPIPPFDRKRQFFLSLDVDLEKIKTDSEFLRILFTALGFIKIPFPALEMSNGNLQFHPLYF